MGWEHRTWQANGLLRDTGVHRDVHRDAWLELCTELERIVQQPKYDVIRASGDGVPDVVD